MSNKGTFVNLLKGMQEDIRLARIKRLVLKTKLGQALFDGEKIKKMVNLIICAPTMMINHSGEPFNRQDNISLNQAKITCEKQYVKSPCVKEFIKREKHVYWVICGREARNR